MFIDRLSIEQRQALYELLCFVAQADNEVSEEEQRLLNRYSNLLGLKAVEDFSTIDIDANVALMKTSIDKGIAIQELIRISYQDGHFGPEEQEKVFSIAKKMGLTDARQVRKIEDWVRRGVEWRIEGEDLLKTISTSWGHS